MKRKAAGLAVLVAFAIWPRAAQTASDTAIPDFAPNATTSWFPDRPTGDDFLPPESGAGPVLSDPAHPYTPNDEGRSTGIQPTYRIGDVNNPNPEALGRCADETGE